MTDALPALLERLRDGTASASERARARALVEGDATLPEDVRLTALSDEADTVADAVGLLALLGAPLVSGPDFASLFEAHVSDIDVADAVADQLGFARLALRDAVVAEAGEVDVSASVFAALGIAHQQVAEAVRAEAGDIDLAGLIFAELGLSARPPAVAVPTPMPLPVNDVRGFGWFARGVSWGAVGLAAAALVAVLVGQPSVPDNVPNRIASTPVDDHLEFAQASDTVIEDLEYAEGVQVVQLEGAEGAVILWVDDGEAG